MSLPNVVAFAAGAALSGKSTAADVLVHEFGYTRLKFAATLKAMAREFLKPLIAEDVLDSYIEGQHKDRLIPALGLTCRDVMISLGTTWGRETIAEDIWVTLTCQHMDRVVAKGGRVVIDDIRFGNEFKAVKKVGGVVYYIHRPCVTPAVHVAGRAEGLIASSQCDAVYVNETTVEALQWWVTNLMEGRV